MKPFFGFGVEALDEFWDVFCKLLERHLKLLALAVNTDFYFEQPHSR